MPLGCRKIPQQFLKLLFVAHLTVLLQTIRERKVKQVTTKETT
jgi:hypothetical protein